MLGQRVAYIGAQRDVAHMSFLLLLHLFAQSDITSNDEEQWFSVRDDSPQAGLDWESRAIFLFQNEFKWRNNLLMCPVKKLLVGGLVVIGISVRELQAHVFFLCISRPLAERLIGIDTLPLSIHEGYAISSTVTDQLEFLEISHHLDV